MPDFILLMQGDAPGQGDYDWTGYLQHLRDLGRFEGGSAIGDGACFRKSGGVPVTTDHVVGYIRIQAHDLADAQSLLAGNPVYEAGATIEVRELPRS
jgi:hypothetical protein